MHDFSLIRFNPSRLQFPTPPHHLAHPPPYPSAVHDFGFMRFDPSRLQFMAAAEIPLAPDAAAVGLDIRVVGNDSGEKVCARQRGGSGLEEAVGGGAGGDGRPGGGVRIFGGQAAGTVRVALWLALGVVLWGELAA